MSMCDTGKFNPGCKSRVWWYKLIEIREVGAAWWTCEGVIAGSEVSCLGCSGSC